MKTTKEQAKIAQEAATAAHTAQLAFLEERGAAESKAQESTNKAFQAAAETLHKLTPEASPKVVGAQLLKACKLANDKANNVRERIPASRISRALKAVHIDGWTEESKGCSVRVHAPKKGKSPADLVADLMADFAKVVDAVNDPAELAQAKKAVDAMITAKIAALQTITIDDVMAG